MKSFRITICQTGLHYDAAYGCDKRTGWSAVYRGSFQHPTLISLWSALWLLLCACYR